MTPHEFVGVLEDALAAEPKGRRAIVLTMHTASIPSLGETGKYVGNDEGGPVYGYTRRQCEAMRERIYAAAREDAGL